MVIFHSDWQSIDSSEVFHKLRKLHPLPTGGKREREGEIARGEGEEEGGCCCCYIVTCYPGSFVRYSREHRRQKQDLKTPLPKRSLASS